MKEPHPGELYGGKYPYAVHGTGSGNMVKRNEMAGGREELAINFLKLPQRHAVPRREVTLLVHWLEAKLAPAEIPKLAASDVSEYVLGRLFATYGESRTPLLPKGHGPRADTGAHALVLGHLFEITKSGVVFWYSGGFYYHYDTGCKLLPITHDAIDMYLSEYPVSSGWLEKHASKGELPPRQVRKVEARLAAESKLGGYRELHKGNVATARKSEKLACPKCGREEAAVKKEERLARQAAEKERRRVEQAAEKERLKIQKAQQREKKAQSDPTEAWKLDFEKYYGTFQVDGTVSLNKTKMQAFIDKCPIAIFPAYRKRLFLMKDAASP